MKENNIAVNFPYYMLLSTVGFSFGFSNKFYHKRIFVRAWRLVQNNMGSKNICGKRGTL